MKIILSICLRLFQLKFKHMEFLNILILNSYLITWIREEEKYSWSFEEIYKYIYSDFN